MDATKKRKVDENGNAIAADATATPSPQVTRKMLEPLTKDQLLEILQTGVQQHPDLLPAVRSVADHDPALRKLFVRALSGDTTSETLRAVFSAYGDLEEAIVIFDKNTGKSKGYGFVTFKHVDGALAALEEPSKRIDGRITVTNLASAGVSGSGPGSGLGSGSGSGSGADVAARKIYVGNVPSGISSERLLELFSSFGEIEEGPLGFDKNKGKPKGFAFIIYKFEEAAKAAVLEPVKMIDGHQIVCKFAADNKKGKPLSQIGDNVQPQQAQVPVQAPNARYGSVTGNSAPFGGGFSGVGANAYGLNTSMPMSVGGGGYGGVGGVGVGAGVSQFGGPGVGGEFGGLSNAGNSMFRLPNPSSVGIGSGGYPDGAGHYGLSQMNQHSQLPPRGPPGGMYQGMPPYY